jgi:hypothetical protein
MSTVTGTKPSRFVPRSILATLCVALLAPGCSSRELSESELLGQEKVVHGSEAVTPEKTPRTKGSAEDAEDALDRARAELGRGDPRAALDIIRLALAQSPPSEQAGKLREMRVVAKRAFLKEAVAIAEAVAEPTRITEGETIRVRVLLRNLSPVPIQISRRSGFSATTARVAITRTATDVFGNRRSDSWEELVPFESGRALPGGAVETTLSLDTEPFRKSFPRGFVEYTIDGFVLPSGVTAGEVEIHDRIRIAETRVPSFPEGWREVAADPSEAVSRGLRVGNPVRILVAARCAGPDVRHRIALRLARRSVSTPPLVGAMSTGVAAALRVLGGDDEAHTWPLERWQARAARAEGTTLLREED